MVNIARRLTLNLPICLNETDHRDRGDGWCNCGQRMPPVDENQKRRVRHVTESIPLPRPRTNLDQIEGNWEEYRGG